MKSSDIYKRSLVVMLTERDNIVEMSNNRKYDLLYAGNKVMATAWTIDHKYWPQKIVPSRRHLEEKPTNNLVDFVDTTQN